MDSSFTSLPRQTQATPPHGQECPCEFCGDLFLPRPQTKHPRSCDKVTCQKARQKANEREWRKKTQPYYPPEYHALQRRRRFKQMKDLAEKFCKCLEVGMTLLSESFSIEAVRETLLCFFRTLGMRRANKLCHSGKSQELRGFAP